MKVILASSLILLWPVSGICRLLAQERFPNASMGVEQKMLPLLRAEALRSLQGSSVLTYKKSVTFPAKAWRGMQERLAGEIFEDKGRIPPDLQGQLDGMRDTPEVFESKGIVSLDFQDITKWRLIFDLDIPKDAYFDRAVIISDGSGFVYNEPISN